MKKGLKIFGIVLVAIIASLFILDYAWKALWIYFDNKGVVVEVNINRHYNNSEEKTLIDAAEQIDCNLAGVDSFFKNDLEGVCISKEDLDSFLAKEKQMKADEDNGSSFSINYNAYVDKNKDWPLDNAGVNSLFKPVILDKDNNIATVESCLDKTGSNYWLVLQTIESTGGRPDKLAGHGLTGKRYLLFDKNENFICQYLYAESWIN